MLQRPISLPLLLILAVAIPLLGRSQIKLASVPSEYVPTAGSELPEPVSMASFFFEVNEETGRDDGWAIRQFRAIDTFFNVR